MKDILGDTLLWSVTILPLMVIGANVKVLSTETCRLLECVVHNQNRQGLKIRINNSLAQNILEKLRAVEELYQPGHAGEWTFQSIHTRYWLIGACTQVRADLKPTDTMNYNGTKVTFTLRYKVTLWGPWTTCEIRWK